LVVLALVVGFEETITKYSCERRIYLLYSGRYLNSERENKLSFYKIPQDEIHIITSPICRNSSKLNGR